MIVDLAVATLLARPPAAALSDRQCRTAIAAAVAHESVATVPASCWRIGPVTLGMKQTEVERRMQVASAAA